MLAQPGDQALLAFVGWLLREDSLELPLSVQLDLSIARMREHRLASLAHRMDADRFREDFIHDALAAELWKQGLREVLEAFDRRGIEACRLKGCAYFLDLYADPAERPMGDLDILIPTEQFLDAKKTLEELGFATRGDKNFTLAPSHHAITLDRHPITVDLHRNMMQEGRSQIDLAGIWARADTDNHRPEALDEIVLHICHMIRSELMVPLVTFVDLGLLLRDGPKRAAVLARCDAFHVGRGARIVLATLDLLAVGQGGRSAPYPFPSTEELVHLPQLPRVRQLLVKALLVEGPRELTALARTTLSERIRRW